MVPYDPLTGAPMEAMMRRFRLLVVLVLATLGGVRCAETPSNPSETLSNPSATPSNTLPELIVSEALAPAQVEAASSAASVVALTFVSLPPGILSNVASVRIRNLTTGGAATTSVPIVDGGFDPVAVPASAGDRLELSFTDGSGDVREEYATVPAKRPPVVVRTAPMTGRTDVALLVRPVVVFSEPIDPATLPVGMRLVTGLTPVNGRIELLEPWVAEFVPTSALEPGTRYELEITQEVHAVGGTELAAPLTAEFTTQPSAGALRFGAVRITARTTGTIPLATYSAIQAHYGKWDYNIDDWTRLGGLDPNGTLIARVAVSSESGGDPYFYRFGVMDLPANCSSQGPTSTDPNAGFTISAGDTVDVEFLVGCGP